ncbi:MAG TPA: hypothetical protein VH417_10165 [Vicinamibacterales bacterium]|jgi:hypothetical protein
MRAHSRLAAIAALLVTIALAPTAGHEAGEWSTPSNLGDIVNSADGDFFSAVSKDGLSLYFTSARPGGYGGFDIYVSQRASVAAPWDGPQNLGPTINSPYDEGAVNLTIDGHTMFFSSNRPGGFGGGDLYASHRHNKRDDFGWQPAENLGSAVNTSANESGPAMFEDDATGAITLLFDSSRTDGPGPLADNPAHTGNDIYSSTILPDGSFGPGTLVAELSTPYFDRKPAVSRDGLTMVFSSNRPGGLGNLDLWASTRVTTSEPWSPPVNLGSTVNSGNNDAGPALSFNGLTLYFQSDRPGGLGAYDLYVITRQKRP